jgi:hypothetical protein
LVGIAYADGGNFTPEAHRSAARVADGKKQSDLPNGLQSDEEQHCQAIGGAN